MIIGIEQTTDARSPETRVARLRSRAHAEEWARASGDYAWSGAADDAVHVCQQNWHRRLRDVYEMPAGWRMPTKREIEAQRGSRPWDDRRSSADIVASMVRRAGTRMPHAT